ncbi:hypothetical protein CC1G_07278 [Coprinopsis cinerea okayama7|uniref:Phospholipid/glycerol acyltransferase domain-containing protein n=1 Tax=Coprinopsis cinerea (strain Okayama-7 / 130 / ATCC MYA-4618 / FGSC 9003) TaxID=240176 RepID=A8NNI0_COPC7|nr:hypothetical protein CC1G_07278 [Coprinopsis cinerea okayama7\|eukprot:XP_001835136.2 hypothetical protein CC1G_07278 [Coprinopsis cinerea okayama7\
MELKLVYRGLRKVSDWILDGYFSEVVVEGKENVPVEGPLVIASTHSNDMIDIAALAVTVPHREWRFLCFWAKSDMFKNPIAAAILRSSGAIPVRRNPNKASSRSGATSGKSSPSKPQTSAEDMAARAALFGSTTKVLDKGGVVGLFPEGGSYTGWRIFQVLPGAAWCGVEHARSGKGREKKGVAIVPTAITYTDKAKFLSRIHVRYGEPILLSSYYDELFDPEVEPNVAANTVVKKITAEMEKRLVGMTVNAPDWETICAVKAARNILWGDEDRIRLQDWVSINQRLAEALGPASQAKTALVKYHSLLYHADVRHSVLESLNSSDTPSPPILSTIARLPLTLVRFIAFLPSLALFWPGYITGRLASKAFTNPLEEEAQCQFKSVGAGLGIAFNLSVILGLLWRAPGSALKRLVFEGNDHRSLWASFGQGISAAYLGVWVLAKWHNLLVNQLQRASKTFDVLEDCEGLSLHWPNGGPWTLHETSLSCYQPFHQTEGYFGGWGS